MPPVRALRAPLVCAAFSAITMAQSVDGSDETTSGTHAAITNEGELQ
jgi:hypothetical protein